MEKVLNTDMRSFKLLKFLDAKGNRVPTVGYTVKLHNTIFFPLVRSTHEVTESVTKMFGPKGVNRSFIRYYFPKKIMYTGSLFPQPLKIVKIDEKEKRDLVKVNLPGFKGVPKNKLIDTRNVILDFSDVINMVLPTDKRVMIRPKVMTYIENVIPEIMCYILFRSDDKKDLLDIKENSTESIMNVINRNNKIEYLDENDVSLESYDEFDENIFSSESIMNLKDELQLDYEDSRSIEAWEENLLKKLRMFSMGGPVTGYDKFGYKNFIVSIPLKTNTIKYYTREFISGRLTFKRNVLTDPNLIYDISLIKMINKLYECKYNNTSTSNEFMKEFLKHRIIFHIHSGDLEFIIDFDECIEKLRYKPARFMNMLINRVKILTMRNMNALRDEDIDNMMIEAEDNILKDEPVKVVEEEKNNYIDIKKSFLKNISKIIHEDKKLQDNIKTITDHKNKEEDFVEETISATQITNNSGEIINPKLNFSNNELDELLGDYGEIEESDSDLEFDDFEDIFDDEQESNVNIDEDDSSNDELKEEASQFKVEEEDEIDPEEEDAVVEEEVESKPVVKVAKPKLEIVKSKAELKRIELLKEKYKSVTIDGKTLDSIIGDSSKMEITERKSELKERIRDESAKKMNLINYQDSYLKNNYHADIINAVKSLSVNKVKPAYIIDAKVEDTSDKFTDKVLYKFTLKDENNKRHNINFELPKIDDNGFVKISGNTKVIKKQILRLPIVKISEDEVIITTQYISLHVKRSGMVLNRGSAVLRKLFSAYFIDNPNISVHRGNGTSGNIDYLTTLEYDSIAQNYFSVEINKDSDYGEHVGFYFDQSYIRKRIEKFDIKSEIIKEDGTISDDILPFGINYTKKSLYYIKVNKNASVSGSIISVLSEVLNDPNFKEYIQKIPVPKRRICTRVEVLNKSVPMIIFVNYLFGWERVKTYLEEIGMVFSEKRIPNTSDLYIKFKNGYLYYKQFPIQYSILLNGLAEMDTEHINYEDLNDQKPYLDYLQHRFSSKNLVKGWMDIKEMMIDAITLQILNDLKLPTELLEIMLYCNELLGDNHFVHESDAQNYRIRGHELIAECTYKIICEQYKKYRQQTDTRSTISIPQNAVMSKLYETNIMDNYDCLSPVSEMKYLSLTTFKGPGGTNLTQALNLEKRAYSDSYIGLFGITTPESGSTGVVKQLTQNPKILNTRGMISPKSAKDKDADFGLSDIASIEEALIPYCNMIDDPNRISFTGSQSKHIVGIVNASQPIVRTGVEKTIQYQVGDTFCMKAKGDGVVTEIDSINKRVFITYKDGTKSAVDYSDKRIRNSDMFINLKFDLAVKVGQKISKYDVIAADTRFFKPDILGGLVYSQGKNAMVAVFEGGYTEEDSSLLNEEFSESMSTNITKRKQIILETTDNIISYKGVGEYVKEGDPLLIFDASGAYEDVDTSEFDDLLGSMGETQLADMIAQTPRASYTGTIVDVAVYWTIPIEKLNTSQIKLINEFKKRIKKEIKQEEEFTGKPSEKRVMMEQTLPDKRSGDGSVTIHGQKIPREGGILIEYMISKELPSGVGDKITMHSSLKTEPSYVVPKNLAFYGEHSKLDAVMSLLSINARMVSSIYNVGALGKVLHDKSKDIANEFLKCLK